MFQLFRSRAKATRYLLGGFLMLVALSMVVTLIPGFGSGPAPDNEQVVAEIGSEKLTLRQVQDYMQTMIRGGRISPELMQVYAPQMVDQMIMDRALAYQAQKMGIRITDEEVRNAFISTFPMFYQNGQLVAREQLEQTLAQSGQSIASAVEEMRKTLAVRQLQNIVLEGIVVTPKEVEEEVARRSQRAKVEYVAFEPAKFTSKVTVTPEEIKSHYERNLGQFTDPAKRSLDLIVADEEKTAASIQVPEATLRQAYQARLDEYRTPERVRVRHILIKTQGKPESEHAKAKAQIEDVLKQLKAGGDFAALAKKVSEDTGSGAKGGDLDWVSRGQTVKNFEDAAFSLKPNELSGVVTTEYGYHILQVTAKEQARVKPFEEVRAELVKDAGQQAVLNKMQESIEKARAAVVKEPGRAEAIAAENNLQFARVAEAAPGAVLPLVGASPELDAALNAAKKGEVTQIVQLPANRLAFAVYTNDIPAKSKPLTAVEGEIRTRLANDKAAFHAQDKAREAVQKAQAGESLEAIAKQHGLTVTSPAEFGRTDVVEGVGSAAYLEDAFQKPAGSIFGPINVQGRNLVARVVSKTEPNLAQLETMRDEIVLALKQKKANERRDLLYDSVLTKLVEDGKVKINREVIQRYVGSLIRG